MVSDWNVWERVFEETTALKLYIPTVQESCVCWNETLKLSIIQTGGIHYCCFSSRNKGCLTPFLRSLCSFTSLWQSLTASFEHICIIILMFLYVLFKYDICGWFCNAVQRRWRRNSPFPSSDHFWGTNRTPLTPTDCTPGLLCPLIRFDPQIGSFTETNTLLYTWTSTQTHIIRTPKPYSVDCLRRDSYSQ